jgi:hypothetical protein
MKLTIVRAENRGIGLRVLDSVYEMRDLRKEWVVVGEWYPSLSIFTWLANVQDRGDVWIDEPEHKE